jgi:hypothetical protein
MVKQCVTIDVLTPAHIVSTNMEISPTSCIEQCEIQVTVKWQNIGESAGSSDLSITVSGGTPTITPLAYSSVPFLANDEVTYSFTVSNLMTGSHTIDAIPSGVESGTIEVTTLTTIEITPTAASIQIGDTQPLTAVCKDENDTVFACPILTWSSGSPSIAGVSSGLVTGLAEGSSSITAAALGITSDPSVITVTTPPLPSPSEAGMGLFMVGGLAVGMLLMSQKKGKVESFTIKQIRESPTRPTRESPSQGVLYPGPKLVSRSNIGNN